MRSQLLIPKQIINVMSNLHLKNQRNDQPLGLYWANAQQSHVFTVYLRPLLEGGWCAISHDIIGLNIEGDTSQEVKQEVIRWVPELLLDNGQVRTGSSVKIIFQHSH